MAGVAPVPAGGDARTLQHGRWYQDNLGTSVNLDGSQQTKVPYPRSTINRQPDNPSLFFGGSSVAQTQHLPNVSRGPGIMNTIYSVPEDAQERRQEMRKELAHWAVIQGEEKEARKRKEKEDRLKEGSEMSWPFEHRRAPVAGRRGGSVSNQDNKGRRVMENAPDQGLFAGLGDSHRQNQRQSAPRAAKEEQLYSANDTYTTTADVPHAQPLLTRAEQIRQNRNQHYDPISWRKMEAQPAPRPPAKYDIQKDPSNIMNTIPSLSRRTPPKQQPQSAYCASTKPLRRIRTDIGAQPRPDHYDHGGVTEYIHPVGVNENAADPSYFHFGRPGAGAPLLHPQTRAIDAHRAGLNRDEKDMHNANQVNSEPTPPSSNPDSKIMEDVAKRQREVLRQHENAFEGNPQYQTIAPSNSEVSASWSPQFQQPTPRYNINPPLKEQALYVSQEKPRNRKQEEPTQLPDPWNWGSDRVYNQNRGGHRTSDVFAGLQQRPIDQNRAEAYHADLDRLVSQRAEQKQRAREEDTRLGLQHINVSGGSGLPGRYQNAPTYGQGMPPADIIREAVLGEGEGRAHFPKPMPFRGGRRRE